MLNEARYPATSTIREDGTVEAIIALLSNPAPRHQRRRPWQVPRRSGTTWGTGTFTLHEGDGRRILVSRADDGSTCVESKSAR